MLNKCIVVLLVALAVHHQVDGAFMYRFLNDWRNYKLVSRLRVPYKNQAAYRSIFRGKRDLDDLEEVLNRRVARGLMKVADKDDPDDLEEVLNNRVARGLMELADKDGDSEVSVDEFNQMIKELRGEE